MSKIPLSYIEISKKNLVHNIKQFRRIVKRGTKIAAVVKANAYGHGDKEVAKAVSPYVDYFQVNSIEELMSIREVTRKQVLLLGYVDKNHIKDAIVCGSILSVFDLHHALLINESARKLGVKQRVHISVDAHLGREGILPVDAPKFIKELKKMKNLKVDGVYAHFANIEDTSDMSHASKQIKAYNTVVEDFREGGYPNIKTHISATSGVFSYEKWNGYNSIVRVGIGLYGMWPSENLKRMWQKKIELKPALRYVTHVAQVKDLKPGESIGYGLSFITKKPTTIAVIPQGYSNGVSRIHSNNGQVIIRGKRAQILGRVAMNMFVVDVTGIKGVRSEDEVVILGTQKGESITAEEVADQSGTINYEVTTRLSPLTPRIAR